MTVPTCPLCGKKFIAITKRGRPFTYCQDCRKLTSDQQLAVEIKNDKEDRT
jgi:hypothetical protein